MDEIEWLSDNQWNAGWIDDQDSVNAVLSELDQPTFGDTEADTIAESDLPAQVFLWKDCPKVLNKLNMPVENQGNLGSCTGFAACRAIEYTQICEIAQGQPEELRLLSRGVQYAGSRTQDGRSPFRGDGSTGAFNAKFATKTGIIDQAQYGPYNLAEYNINQIRQWASNGLPSELLPNIRKHTINNCTLINDLLQLRKALAQGYGISVCSNQGFTTRRGNNGVCNPQGNWAHAMCISGYITLNDKIFVFIENSWGLYMGTSNPAPLNANLGTFLARGDVVETMLRQRDTFAYAGVNGFQKKKLDWSI